MGYRAFPAEINTLCRYIAHLAERLQASSIPKYLSIIRLVHSEMGLPSPITQNWTLDSLLRGVKRDKGLVVKRKLPITPDILLKIHSSLNLKTVTDILFWAACLVGFFGLFRKANLLPVSHNSTGYHFLKSDVSFIAGGLLMRVRGSKTIQFGERDLSVPLPLIPGSPLCPTTAVTAVLLSTPNLPLDTPLYVYGQGGDMVKLTQSMFSHKLTKVMSGLGYEAKLFSGHSLRRGGASWAFQRGLPGEIIQVMGDWKSDA